MTIHLPLTWNESQATLNLKLDNNVFDLIQSLIFRAEEYVDPQNLMSRTEHKFSDIVVLRNRHFLDYADTLLLSFRELDLLGTLLSPKTVQIHYPQGQGDFQFAESADARKLYEETKAVFLQINNVIQWSASKG